MLGALPIVGLLFQLVLWVWTLRFFARFLHIRVRYGLDSYRERMETRTWEYWTLGTMLAFGFSLIAWINMLDRSPADYASAAGAFTAVAVMPLLVAGIYAVHVRRSGILSKKSTRVAQAFFHTALWWGSLGTVGMS